ncbi:MAG TPA: carboxypeptidase regulatory-like domain-containing protein [Gemmataceae bacterium]
MVRGGCGLRLAFVAITLFGAQRPCALAWGPHSQITQAALDALGPKDPLIRYLGSQAKFLSDYCWLGDWPRGLIVQERQAFYADDYLLFPLMPQHVQHICPAVRRSFRPHFQRAVQALHTETPANAVRWIGALLHYTEDAGSPPHALGILGDIHTKMENWVDAKRIQLGDYQPRTLGVTEEQALAGYMKRMEELIAYSKERGEQLRPLVEKGERARVEPLVLECALEVSRVVADLLHTLGQLALLPAKDKATLEGTITARPAFGLEKVLAKVVLKGTTFSTLADAAGTYVFHHLPAGDYQIAVLSPGSELSVVPVKLAAGEKHRQDIALARTEPAGNLVRNPAFRWRWVQPKMADGWYRRRSADKNEWHGEILPVQAGRRYRLSVRWKEGATGEVALLWDNGETLDKTAGFEGFHYYSSKPRKADTPLAAPQTARTFLAPPQARCVLIVFRTSNPPDSVCEHVALVPER